MTRPSLEFFPDLAFGWTFYSVLVGLLIAASVVDYRSLRIPKSLTVTCLVLGVLFNLGRGMWLGLQDKEVWKLQAGPALGALDGFLFSLAGFATAFAIFFALWFLRAAGGGDVKLFAAVGAWVGPLNIVFLMIGSVVMILLITIGMIVVSLTTSGFSSTHKSFSSQGSKKAAETGKRGKQRGPAFAFPLMFATAVILLLVFRSDLGLADRVPLPATVSQAQ